MIQAFSQFCRCDYQPETRHRHLFVNLFGIRLPRDVFAASQDKRCQKTKAAKRRVDDFFPLIYVVVEYRMRRDTAWVFV